MELQPGICKYESAGGEPQPQHRPARTWAGHGSGAVCNGCGSPIAEHEIEYEVELSAGSLVRNLRFHFLCYQGWHRGSAAAKD